MKYCIYNYVVYYLEGCFTSGVSFYQGNSLETSDLKKHIQSVYAKGKRHATIKVVINEVFEDEKSFLKVAEFFPSFKIKKSENLHE